MPGDIPMHQEDDFTGALKGTSEGTVITLEVSAGSGRDRFPSGYNPWRKSIGCQVTAPPVGGKANQAVISLLSSIFSLPRSRFTIISGATAPLKKVLVRAVPPGEIAGALKKAWDSR